MIRHVALFTFTDEVTEDDVARIDASLAALPGLIGEITSYSFGRDLKLGTGTYDYVIIGEFSTVADYETYSVHPEHVRVLGEIIKPFLKDVARVQTEIS